MLANLVALPRLSPIRFSLIISFILLIFSQKALALDLTFSWNANPEENIAGYHIHYGTESQTYTHLVDAGMPSMAADGKVTFTINNLSDQIDYYFSATAYDEDGLESELSREAVWISSTAFPAESLDDLSEEWHIVATADFNGNGEYSAILRHHNDGQIWLLIMDKENIIDSKKIANLSNNWDIAGVADFTGDDTADIILRHRERGQLWLYEMNDNSITASTNIGALHPDWEIAGIADFSDDNIADLLLRHIERGQLWLYEMNGNSIIASNNIGGLSTDWDVIAASDFNADKMADILLRHHDRGQLWV